LVLKKDKELFSHGKDFKQIPKEHFTYPSLDDVTAALAHENSPSNLQVPQEELMNSA
jgi:hypothetical protein